MCLIKFRSYWSATSLSLMACQWKIWPWIATSSLGPRPAWAIGWQPTLWTSLRPACSARHLVVMLPGWALRDNSTQVRRDGELSPLASFPAPLEPSLRAPWCLPQLTWYEITSTRIWWSLFTLRVLTLIPMYIALIYPFVCLVARVLVCPTTLRQHLTCCTRPISECRVFMFFLL